MVWCLAETMGVFATDGSFGQGHTGCSYHYRQFAVTSNLQRRGKMQNNSTAIQDIIEKLHQPIALCMGT